MPFLLSVNLGAATATTHSDIGVTGIDKKPVTGPVEVCAPGAQGGSGLAGDRVCDLRHHDVTIDLAFRALTAESALLPRLLVADALPEEARQRARRREPIELDEDSA